VQAWECLICLRHKKEWSGAIFDYFARWVGPRNEGSPWELVVSAATENSFSDLKNSQRRLTVEVGCDFVRGIKRYIITLLATKVNGVRWLYV
jgi:hypothetical protein